MKEVEYDETQIHPSDFQHLNKENSNVLVNLAEAESHFGNLKECGYP
jgi:hypothetical protein